MYEVHGLHFGRLVDAKVEGSERIHLRARSLGTIHAASLLRRLVHTIKCML